MEDPSRMTFDCVVKVGTDLEFSIASGDRDGSAFQPSDDSTAEIMYRTDQTRTRPQHFGWPQQPGGRRSSIPSTPRSSNRPPCLHFAEFCAQEICLRCDKKGYFIKSARARSAASWRRPNCALSRCRRKANRQNLSHLDLQNMHRNPTKWRFSSPSKHRL